MHTLNIKDDIRLCVDNNNVFFQQYRDDFWDIVSIPIFYFCNTDNDYNSRNYVGEDILDDIDDFFARVAPWVNEIEINQDDVDGYLKEVYGRSCPDNINALARAILACNVVLSELRVPYRSFDDGYYNFGFVPAPSEVLASQDLKHALYLLIGIYTKPMGKSVRNHLSGDYHASYKLALLRFLYGLKAENVVKVMDESMMFSRYLMDKLEYGGLVVDEYGYLEIPSWVLQSPENYRVEWMCDDFELFLDCVSLSLHNKDDLIDVDYNTKDIFLIHNRIIDALNYSFVLDNLDLQESVSPVYTQEIGVIDNISFITLKSAFDLACVGREMNVCVGSEMYYKRLLSGSSVFIQGTIQGDHLRDKHILAEIDVKTNKIIECRKNQNHEVSDEEFSIVEKAVKRMFNNIDELSYS